MNTQNLPADFFSKVASHRGQSPVKADAHSQLCGVADYLHKEAGLSPAQIYGFVKALAQMGERLNKQANDPTLEAVGEAGDFVGGFSTGGLLNKGVDAVSGAVSNAVSKSPLAGKVKAAVPLLKTVAGSTTEELKNMNQAAKTYKGLGPNGQAVVNKSLDLLKGNEDVMKMWQEGKHLDALSLGGGRTLDWLKNNKTFKTWGVPAIGALTAFGGAKLLGAGTGTALAAGAVGGLAGANYDNIKSLFSGAKKPEPETPSLITDAANDFKQKPLTLESTSEQARTNAQRDFDISTSKGSATPAVPAVPATSKSPVTIERWVNPDFDEETNDWRK